LSWNFLASSGFASESLRAAGSRAAGVAMAFKLIESAQTRWRAVSAPHLVALVRAGAVFKNGKLIERPDESAGGGQQVARHADPQVLTIPQASPARSACRAVAPWHAG
jgi:hypothetical protein